MKEIKINSEIIKLDAFMKWAAIVVNGGEAKVLIQEGLVKVNGNVETQRGKKLKVNDIIEFDGESYKIV